jgi:hypothetical protein
VAPRKTEVTELSEGTDLLQGEGRVGLRSVDAATVRGYRVGPSNLCGFLLGYSVTLFVNQTVQCRNLGVITYLLTYLLTYSMVQSPS